MYTVTNGHKDLIDPSNLTSQGSTQNDSHILSGWSGGTYKKLKHSAKKIFFYIQDVRGIRVRRLCFCSQPAVNWRTSNSTRPERPNYAYSFPES